jgi:hypothetical protein
MLAPIPPENSDYNICDLQSDGAPLSANAKAVLDSFCGKAFYDVIRDADGLDGC